jgi:hypothetical protein
MLRNRKGKISVVLSLLGPRLEELEGVLAVGSDCVTSLLPDGTIHTNGISHELQG